MGRDPRRRGDESLRAVPTHRRQEGCRAGGGRHDEARCFRAITHLDRRLRQGRAARGRARRFDRARAARDLRARRRGARRRARPRRRLPARRGPRRHGLPRGAPARRDRAPHRRAPRAARVSATLRWLRRWGISFASLTGGIFTLFVFRRGLPHVAWIIGYLLILWLLFALIT